MGSPAGRRIGLAAGAALTLVAALAPAASGAPEDKRELAVITATGQAHQFRVIEPGGAPVRTVFARSSGFGIASPSWSRDEKTLAYSESQQVFVVPAEGGAEQPVTSGSLPAFSPAGDELAFWRGRELRAIRPDGTGDRLIAGPFATTPLSPPAWSPDGSFLAVAIGGAILRQPAAGGPATVIAAPAADEILSRPALAPDGKQIAFAREFFANVPAGTPRAGDQLVVRDLASGGEHLAWQGPDPGVQGFAGFASTYGGISWSADSDRIAYPELDPTPTNRLVTVKSDGSGDRKVLVDNTLIQGAAWANAPRLPSYSVRHVEVTQALSPTLVPPLQFDPPAGEPYALAWSQPAPFGFGLPLIAGKSTLLRVYVADASLPPGASATRTLRVSLVDATSGIDYGAGPDRAVTVTAPDVAPQQEQEGAALNVWVAPEAAAAGAPRTFSVDVNPGEVLPECVGCYPKGNHAEVTQVRFDDGGSLVIAPVPINVITPDSRTVLTPDPAKLKAELAEAAEMLPVGDADATIGVSPGSLLVEQRDITADEGCDFLLAKLLAWRRGAGDELPGASPVAGSGAVRWVGYTRALQFPPGGTECRGKGQLQGGNLVILGPSAPTFAHELGHTLGLEHTKGTNTVNPPAGAVALPYAGIGGVGYEPPFGGITTIYRGTTGDIMSYDDARWTSPRSWARMNERLLAESQPGLRRADVHAAARASAAAAPRRPAERRIVAGVLRGADSEILDSFVVGTRAAPDAGPVAATVVARGAGGRVLARAKVRGTPVQEPGGAAAALPFAVALPEKRRPKSLELRARAGGKPLVRLKASRRAPSGRLLGVPKRARAAKPLTVRWRARDRDRGATLSVLLRARRGKGAPGGS